MQKYRFDKEGPKQPNGAIPLYSEWIGGPSLAGIRDCPVIGTSLVRTVYITGEPDTYFSQPAVCKVKGKRIKGFVSSSEEGLQFTPFLQSNFPS